MFLLRSRLNVGHCQVGRSPHSDSFVPGKFTVSSEALTGAVTASTSSLIATTIDGGVVSPTDVSEHLDLVVEAQIGASSSSSDFTAVVNTLIKDAGQVSTSMSVGIGSPDVTPSNPE